MGIFKLFTKGVLRDIRVSFSKVERELNDHLDSINANSNEIAYVYEMNAKLEEKIDKLKDRIEEMEMRMGLQKMEEYDIDELTQQEKQVFIAIYTHTRITYAEMAEKLNFPDVMVQEYVTNLIAKGVPVQKSFKKNIVFVSLDENFKEVQAKKRIVALR